MEYCHVINQDDSFYSNWGTQYFLEGSTVIGITIQYHGLEICDSSPTGLVMNSFNYQTKLFTPDEELTEVDYDLIGDITLFFDYLTYMFVINTVTKQYAKTTEFPYLISEIDGNYIVSCRLNTKIYIFHSRTEGYETGIFIIDTGVDKFNEADFWIVPQNSLPDCDDNCPGCDNCDWNNMVPRHGNRFKSLSGKDVADCFIVNDEIVIAINDHPGMFELYKYNSDADIMVELYTIPYCNTIKVSGNVLVCHSYTKREMLCFHDIHTGQLIREYPACESDEVIRFLEVHGDELIILCEKYVNPYGQIYRETHEEEFATRNLQVKVMNIISLCNK